MKKRKVSSIKPEQKKAGLENKNIDIGKSLSYRDDIYCEVMRPTYSLYHISVILIAPVAIYILCCAYSIMTNETIDLRELAPILIGIWVFIYFCCLLSKDFRTHVMQSYYQPIVFNRKQQKIFIYYDDSKQGMSEVIILDMLDVTPFIEVSYFSETSMIKRHKYTRHFLEAKLMLKDRNQRCYPLFHHFYQCSDLFFRGIEQEKKELLNRVEGELAGYWNWCETYMKHQDKLLPMSKITRRFFSAQWSEDTRRLFITDNS